MYVRRIKREIKSIARDEERNQEMTQKEINEKLTLRFE